MNKFREVKGSTGASFLTEQRMNSSIDKNEEFWAVIRISAHKAKSRMSSSEHIKLMSFVDQGYRFWHNARDVHTYFQSSALLYYYCFLNLEKAVLMLRYSLTINDVEYHGLAYDRGNKGRFDTDTVLVKDGVYKNFYTCLLSRVPPPKIRIAGAMSYIIDIGMQYADLVGQMRAVLITATVVQYPDKMWGVLIAVPRSSRFQFHYRDFNEFSLLFERVSEDLPIDITQRQLTHFENLNYDEYFIYQFKDQATTTKNQEAIKKTIDVFGDRLGYSLYSRPFTALVYYKELAQDSGQRMNEQLSILASMFYLGDLVRYRPLFMSALLKSDYQLVIEGFMNNAPTRFLQACASNVLGRAVLVEN